MAANPFKESKLLETDNVDQHSVLGGSFSIDQREIAV
jgi:hypothetical protein